MILATWLNIFSRRVVNTRHSLFSTKYVIISTSWYTYGIDHGHDIRMVNHKSSLNSILLSLTQHMMFHKIWNGIYLSKGSYMQVPVKQSGFILCCIEHIKEPLNMRTQLWSDIKILRYYVLYAHFMHKFYAQCVVNF